MDRRLEQPAAERAVAQERERRLLRRVLDRESPAVWRASLGGELRRRRDLLRTQTIELRDVFDHDRRGFVRLEQPALEFGGECGLLAVQFAEPRLVRRRETCAGANEIQVISLDEAALFGRQGNRVAPVVDVAHAREQPVVEVDRVGVLGESRRFICLNGLQALVGIRGCHRGEHAQHARQQLSRPLERGERVVERRRLALRDDLANLAKLPRHPFLDRGRVVLVANQVEARRSERKRARRGEGIRVEEAAGCPGRRRRRRKRGRRLTALLFV